MHVVQEIGDADRVDQVAIQLETPYDDGVATTAVSRQLESEPTWGSYFPRCKDVLDKTASRLPVPIGRNFDRVS